MYDRQYYDAVRVSHMRKLMRYDFSSYQEDWNVLISCAQLRAMGSPDELETVMDSCMDRILAWEANHPMEVPFD